MFLETITWMDNDVLVPIDRIKYITKKYDKDYHIIIISDDGDWEEHFGIDKDRWNARYQQIKQILKAK